MEESWAKSILKNKYFWFALALVLVAGYLIFLLSAMLLFNVKTKVAEANQNKVTELTQAPRNSAAERILKNIRLDLDEKSGRIDSDVRKLIIVVKVKNLDSKDTVNRLRNGNTQVEIDNQPAEILNTEPFPDGFFVKAVAPLETAKFDNFMQGNSGDLQLKLTFLYEDASSSQIILTTFSNGNTKHSEGWKVKFGSQKITKE
jgi:hypothetical protein